MKKALFLDDDRRRTATFLHWIEDLECEAVTVETADECIARLREGDFDLVLLDHDLGGEIYCDSSREDCGMEVVRWLKRHRGKHGAFIVHTFNAVAGASMFMELKTLGYRVAQAPFGSPEFYQRLKDFLGSEEWAEPAPRSIRDRLTDYFRSLRLGR